MRTSRQLRCLTPSHLPAQSLQGSQPDAPQVGIPDLAARQKLIEKARAIVEAGDRALAYEKQQAR
jgi:hypothetical protein